MIKVDCSELRGEVKLALAEAISEGLGGSGVALLDGDYVAIDALSGPDVGAARVQSIVSSYLSTRKDASAYRVESDGQRVVVHSSAQVTAQQKRVEDKLPPGLFQCPVCGFVTTSDDAYQYHLRMHDLVRGVA
jgi:hypothetical protein